MFFIISPLLLILLHHINYIDSLDDTAFSKTNVPNYPLPQLVFKDSTNTNTIGNNDGSSVPNASGQKPGESTRRDSHGAGATADGSYVHVVDRIQNVVESFDVSTYTRFTYDLTSSGACGARSVGDDNNLPSNDPAPDLFEITPDGEYFAIAFRGPAPVTVSHSAQGSCPGVGIVKITGNGKTGRLVDVLRTTNTITDNVASIDPDGGVSYAGNERSDVHGAIVVFK